MLRDTTVCTTHVGAGADGAVFRDPCKQCFSFQIKIICGTVKSIRLNICALVQFVIDVSGLFASGLSRKKSSDTCNGYICHVVTLSGCLKCLQEASNYKT